MPCFLTGRIVITDFERMKLVARQFNLILSEDELRGQIEIYREDELVASVKKSEILKGVNSTFKTIIRQYNIMKIKLAAQKKGWTISSIKEDKDKITVKIRE